MELSSLPFHLTTFLSLLLFLLLLFSPAAISAAATCRNMCGNIPVRYPFGTGPGCGSPRFFPSVTCSTAASPGMNNNNGSIEVLTFSTHTGTYPITSISYESSTLTIFPPFMSTCNSMHTSAPAIGLDWAAPFQLGPSLFALLSCGGTGNSNSALLSYCDPSPAGARLCGALTSSCPALGLPTSAATDGGAADCCSFAPAAALGPHDDLDPTSLGCRAYTSVLSFGAVPTDPNTWQYGVVLRYEPPVDDPAAEICGQCESSGGACGYTPPENYFLCVCANDVNTTTDCTNINRAFKDYWRSSGERRLQVVACLRLMVVLLIGSFWLVKDDMH